MVVCCNYEYSARGGSVITASGQCTSLVGTGRRNEPTRPLLSRPRAPIYLLGADYLCGN